jgi:hypothetical protein
MNEAIKAILSELPSYLFNLIRLLTGPGKFVSSIEFKEENKLLNITRALTFACVSYILSAVLASINLSSHLDPNVNLYSYYASDFVITVLVFIGFLIALVAAVRLAGGEPPLDRLFVVHAYYFGIFMVLFRTLGSITEGWLKFDQRWRNSEQPAAGAETAAYFLLFFTGVVLLIWGIAAWKAYGQISNLPTGRSTGAMTLSWLFSIPVLALSFFMSEAWLPTVKSANASPLPGQASQRLPVSSPGSAEAAPQSHTREVQTRKYSGPLIGAWASHGITLEESYLFREDGNFRHGSGQILQGEVLCQGTYTINRNVLTLRVKQPAGGGTKACDDVDEFQFHFENRDTLVLVGTGEDTFERVK